VNLLPSQKNKSRILQWRVQERAHLSDAAMKAESLAGHVTWNHQNIDWK
jgi:hypothetical protein